MTNSAINLILGHYQIGKNRDDDEKWSVDPAGGRLAPVEKYVNRIGLG
jgi:hypothetical protein